MAIIVVWVCEVVKVWLSAVVCCCFTDGRVVKFLVEQNNNNALHGQVTIGTLILQVTSSFLFHSSQVETFAQFGVVFLLFALGLEFSLTKLKAVGHVAVLGGLLQIAIFMFLCGITAALCGAKLSEGVFVGSFLSMSSTAVWPFARNGFNGEVCSDKLGLNLELGSFIAGVMISSADFAKHTLDQEACRSLCKFQFLFRVLSEDDIVAGIFTGSLARNLIVGVLALIFGSFVG
ncbi:Na H Exchanger domain-containing protein [Citrus sinensis]|uniref:Na H Exchanger domain-containing protein n=1 Tax=Citrus sinensis TaxID=2711 RepID=A0ACB8K9D5_CITSI|nr:Na H Exchanger domain-containing protein [Citrus sinensis]